MAVATDTVEIRELRDELGMSQRAFSRLLGITERTVASWERGKSPNGANRQRLEEVHRLVEALTQVVRGEAIGPWLERPNRAFDGLTPIEVIERGQVDRIWRMVYLLESGLPI